VTNDTIIGQGSTGAAVKDVQARLQSIGYDLAQEFDEGIFGVATAGAVASFREHLGLNPGEEVDYDTWTALVDATFTLGDRLLYLRMPYLHGRDVHTLQTALAALGFSCTADAIFGAHTEHAVREFQQNAGISGDGIVGDSTFSAIERLRHAWEGKDLINLEAHSLGFARAAEVLENTPICIYGTDEIGRNIAERISNLAMATTQASLVVSAQSLDQAPSDSMLMLQITNEKRQKVRDESHIPPTAIPQVIYDSDETLPARIATAVELISTEQPRIMVLLSRAPLTAREEQHAAVALLDALCLCRGTVRAVVTG
jgi:peptidoglycan hydrolase-like protein with peptidoglycan-binding domain